VTPAEARPSFGSDNHSGVHPEIMAAITAANRGHAHAFGDDPVTARAEERFRAHFGLHANRMARLLASLAAEVPGVEIVQKVQANGVFARIPKRAIASLQRQFFFYVWNAAASEVRWMCSFDTREEDVREFVRMLGKAVRLRTPRSR